MAVFQIQMFSPTLQTNTGVTVIIPTPDSSEMQQPGGMDYFCDGVKYQVLYLLHGLYGDHTNWLRYTSIERYVQDRRLAVVMPAVGNSFYQDMYHGPDYLTYITQELPRYICRLFPVSDRREDTFVAGLSMGGYGAVKCAFQYPEQYAACVSLSGALDVEGLLDNFGTGDPRAMWWNIFKDPQSARTGEANLFVLAKKRQREGRQLPPVFQTIGTEDYLYQNNQTAKAKLEALGIVPHYTEHPGVHDWAYWDRYIQEALDWFPLKNRTV